MNIRHCCVPNCWPHNHFYVPLVGGLRNANGLNSSVLSEPNPAFLHLQPTDKNGFQFHVKLPSVSTTRPVVDLGSMPSTSGFGTFLHYQHPQHALATNLDRNITMTRALASSSLRKERGEKKLTPEDLKDDRYFERRRRNNMAAKRSRDARKCREEHVAAYVKTLEKENAILKVQVIALRKEDSELKQLLFLKRTREELAR